MGYILESKIDRKRKKRDFDAVNGVLFHKTVSNRFITVENVVFNILISCQAIPEFVALKWATFRVKESIANVKKRVEDPVNDDLFSISVSNKFITVQNIVFNILLSCYSIPEFVA